MMPALLGMALAGAVPSSPSLGIEEGRCRPAESGPSFLIDVRGLKDRKGRLRVELYPANDEDFLADDNILLNAGKVFRRVEMDVPQSGPALVCIRAPSAGSWAMSLLHDRDGNRKFSLSEDGVAFPGDPRLGLSKPKARDARANAQNGPTRIAVTMQYRRGLFGFGPSK